MELPTTMPLIGMTSLGWKAMARKASRQPRVMNRLTRMAPNETAGRRRCLTPRLAATVSGVVDHQQQNEAGQWGVIHVEHEFQNEADERQLDHRPDAADDHVFFHIEALPVGKSTEPPEPA